MSDPLSLAFLILGLLLAATLITALFDGLPGLKSFAHLPLVICCGTSAVLAVILLIKVMAADQTSFISEPVTWFSAGKFKVFFSLAIDPLTAIMLAMITFVATWIAIFSSSYMRDEHHHPDRGYIRYFAVMSLFVFSMCGLVLSNNFFVLIGFWEGVGVCSYLLVGYYFDKPAAARAARKAFLVTRLGDTGFILGLFMLWKLGGWHTNLDEIFEFIRQHPPNTELLTTACLLVFCGAVGKSAQFPLYVWLPDAMEGPSPVSALIHAATMVTAGVYLVARCAPLFVLAPDAQLVICWIGGITALLAAFIALAQSDLKRVLAYSTVSQLGFMFMALGTMSVASPLFAVTAAIFHLFTHAFFKALLFLAAGSVMHAMGNVIDMRRFSGLRKIMPITHLTFLCGAAALAGLPLLSGFWSKDMILESLQLGAESTRAGHESFRAVLGIALVTAALTAFYTFRAYFLTFWGDLKVPEEAGHHAHESPSVMTIPLLVLAIGALFVGAIVEPVTNHGFSNFLGRTPSLELANSLAGSHSTAHKFNWGLAGLSSLLALGGFGLAMVAYGRGGPEYVPGVLEPVYSLSRHKLYLDEIYRVIFVRPLEWLSFMAKVSDLLLDSLARLISMIPRFIGGLVQPIQNGLVQFYALSMTLGIVVFLSFVVFRITR